MYVSKLIWSPRQQQEEGFMKRKVTALALVASLFMSLFAFVLVPRAAYAGDCDVCAADDVVSAVLQVIVNDTIDVVNIDQRGPAQVGLVNISHSFNNIRLQNILNNNRVLNNLKVDILRNGDVDLDIVDLSHSDLDVVVDVIDDVDVTLRDVIINVLSFNEVEIEDVLGVIVLKNNRVIVLVKDLL
jgi:hypothetical protein